MSRAGGVVSQGGTLRGGHLKLDIRSPCRTACDRVGSATVVPVGLRRDRYQGRPPPGTPRGHEGRRCGRQHSRFELWRLKRSPFSRRLRRMRLANKSPWRRL
jgi:hypothetical protein